MPRTPMIAEALYLFANAFLPDEGPLALQNAFYELHQGQLTADDPKADEAADDETHLAAFIGHVQLREGQFSFHKVFAGDMPEEHLLAMGMEAIQGIPSGTIEDEAIDEIKVNLPSTLALMAVWRKEERIWTAFYRHPEVPTPLAAAILKEVVKDFHLEEKLSSGTEGPSN